MTKKRVVASVLIVLIALLVGGVFLLRGGMPRRKPLGEAALIQFQQTAKPDENVKAFLSEDFEIIKGVAALPEPIRKLYTEAGGSRFVLADPGQKFEATDVISDPSLPRKRLIFAGVTGEHCFVHYEQGGFGHSFRLALFELNSPSTVTPLWLGSCGPATNIDALRSQVRDGCDY
jgi:hypothetical protein